MIGQPLRRRLAIAGATAIVVTALASTIFWLRLPGRMPTDDDYRQANELIRSQLQPGDIIVLAPGWADRGRPFLTAGPVYSGYDLAHDEYRGTKRQWLVALYDVPRFNHEDARTTLLARGPSAAAGRQIGGLWVEPFAIPGPAQLYSFTDRVGDARVSLTSNGGNEECSRSPDGSHHCSRGPWNEVRPAWHEIDEKPVYCLWAHPVDGADLRIEYPDVPLHGHVRGWGGLVGRAAESGDAPVHLRVEANGRPVETEEFPNSFDPKKFDVTLPNDSPANGTLTFVVSTPNAGMRHFCFDAWVGP